MRIKVKALGVIGVIAIVIAAGFFLFKATANYIVNDVLNECQVCGARTLDRYHVQTDSGEIVWVCPLCAQEM